MFELCATQSLMVHAHMLAPAFNASKGFNALVNGTMRAVFCSQCASVFMRGRRRGPDMLIETCQQVVPHIHPELQLFFGNMWSTHPYNLIFKWMNRILAHVAL